jgi:DNA polymerase-3 subunit beta
MKLSCPARELARALDSVVHVVRNRPVQPVLGYVLMEAEAGRLALTATDLEVGVRRALSVEVAAEGAVAAPARLLAELAAALPDARVTLEAAGNALVLTCGRFVTSLCTLPAGEFPPGLQPEEVDRLRLPVEALLRAVEQVRPALSTDTGRPVLTGMLFRLEAGCLQLLATDGHRIAMRRLAGVEGELNASLVVPAAALAQLPRVFRDLAGELEILASAARSQIFFRCGGSEVASRLLPGEFPDVERVLPKEYPASARLAREDLIKTARTVALFADGGARAVRLRCQAGSVLLTAEADAGDARAELRSQLTGDEFQVAFNGRYLVDALTAMDGDEVELRCAGPLAPGLIRGAGSDECFHVIMPVRLEPPAGRR